MDGFDEEELEPYKLMIRNGIADAVMTAHVVHRQLDNEELPATLSSRIITGLLEEQMGFTGVVVSDDLQMKAISDRWGLEKAVQKALDRLMQGRTTLVVAHRLSTIRNVDRIYVLVGGRVVEQGSHDDLLERDGEFARLYNLQFAPSEEVGETGAEAPIPV